jgi:hypothetical protein
MTGFVAIFCACRRWLLNRRRSTNYAGADNAERAISARNQAVKMGLSGQQKKDRRGGLSAELGLAWLPDSPGSF